MGYDAYYVALEAIKAAGSARHRRRSRPPCPASTYAGVSGAIAFDDIGDAIRDTAFIKTADTANGAWVLETACRPAPPAELAYTIREKAATWRGRRSPAK